VSGDEKGIERVERGDSWTGYQVAKKMVISVLEIVRYIKLHIGCNNQSQ